MAAKVDIVIPVHNQIKVTEACLNSIYRNTDVQRFYLIVVDSGSDDSMKAFLKNYLNFAPNMTVIREEVNIGWCKALNLGFKHLHNDADYVLWANNDIVFESDWLEKMIAAFKPGIGAVGPTSNYVMGRQQAIYNHSNKHEPTNLLVGFCLMFHRSVIDIVGDVDERFGIGGSEEIDYIIRMKKETRFGCMIARDVYIHHFGSMTLWDYAGGTVDSYNQFTIDKDKILRDKWGDEVVDELMKIPERHILCCVPHRGVIDPRFWMDTLLMAKPPGLEFAEGKRISSTHDARNALVEFSLRENFKYLLFIDDDMRIPHDAVFKLLSHQKPIISGCFYSRSYPHFPCMFRWDAKNNGLVAVHKPRSGLVEVDAVGMAFTLISTDVLRKMRSPWFHWNNGLGEDMNFCLDAKKTLGTKIFTDTDLIIRHITDEKKEIGPEDYVEGKV